MQTLDWVVIAAYFLALFGLAWWVMLRSRKTADDYFLAGRNLGWFVIGASIFAANIGSEHLVGLAGSGATDGVAMAHYELHAWCLLVLAWVLVGGGVLTSLLTLYVIARVWTKAFWRSREDAPEGHLAAASPAALLDDADDVELIHRDDVGRMPVGMLLPTGALIAVGLTLTVLAGPIFSYSSRAADEVLDRGQYISAVMGK